jgi:hypothetical protein
VASQLLPSSAYEGFINLNDLAFATQLGEMTITHRLTQAMGHEPSGLVSDLERVVELEAAEALLAGGQKMRGLKPQMQLDVAGLEKGADRGPELQLALPTALEPRSGSFPADNRDPIHSTTMRAYGAVRPHDGLKLLAGRFLAVEVWFDQDVHDSDSQQPLHHGC